MEKELKNINFFELPSSFEENVIKKIRTIKRRRKRRKLMVLPLILITILSLSALILIDFKSVKGKVEGESLTMVEPSEQRIQEDIYLELIPVENFEKENRYLIEFVRDNEEKIYAF